MQKQKDRSSPGLCAMLRHLGQRRHHMCSEAFQASHQSLQLLRGQLSPPGQAEEQKQPCPVSALIGSFCSVLRSPSHLILLPPNTSSSQDETNQNKAVMHGDGNSRGGSHWLGTPDLYVVVYAVMSHEEIVFQRMIPIGCWSYKGQVPTSDEAHTNCFLADNSTAFCPRRKGF